MALTLASAADLLKEHHLLREIIQGDVWTDDPARIASADEPFAGITYDTRKVTPGTLLCCKGRFKAEYLNGIDEAGLAAYVAETEYSAATAAPGLIVNDARKAMSLLSAAFYGYPQNELTVIGVTGTKGKTTTSYFTQALINAVSGGKAALFSSVDNCLDGHTYVESDLTTPESMDAFRMMREAADNGMEYLVMEVSSQAYKVDRVYGLTFDVAAFLNISPDHISPIEHPTFEDYLYCKRQIIANAKSLVLGADSLHADLLREDAAAAGIGATTFALHDADNAGTSADVVACPPTRSTPPSTSPTEIRPLATTICPSMATSTTSMRRRPSPSPMRLAYRSMTPTHCTPSNPYVSPAVWNSSATRSRTRSPSSIMRTTTHPSPRCLTSSTSVGARKTRVSRW